MHDKEQKHGLNPISNASLRAKMAAWTSPSVFSTSEGLCHGTCQSHSIFSCELCDRLGKATGLPMTVCIGFLFHYLRIFTKISLNAKACSLQSNRELMGGNPRGKQGFLSKDCCNSSSQQEQPNGSLQRKLKR